MSRSARVAVDLLAVDVAGGARMDLSGWTEHTYACPKVLLCENARVWLGRHPVVWLIAALGVAMFTVGRVLDAHGHSVAGAALFYGGLACVPLMITVNWKTRP